MHAFASKQGKHYLSTETELEALEQNPAFRLITQIELLEKRNHLRLSYKKAN